MERKPPTWEEIRELIQRVDQVCRESEYLRAQAERARNRPIVWPDRRHSPRQHDDHHRYDSREEPSSTPEGSDGTL